MVGYIYIMKKVFMRNLILFDFLVFRIEKINVCRLNYFVVFGYESLRNKYKYYIIFIVFFCMFVCVYLYMSVGLYREVRG